MEEEKEEVEEEGEEEGGETETQLLPSTAQRIHRTIVRVILPSLQAVLTKKVGVGVDGLAGLDNRDGEIPLQSCCM